MKLKLVRDTFTQKSTIGRLFIDGAEFCHTLEDCVRAVKIPNETAIPEGTYRVFINHSNRFDRNMPLVSDVPGFEGIRIHAGNTDKDTEGCILLGFTRSTDFIGESRKAFDLFFDRLSHCFAALDIVTLEVTSETNGRGVKQDA